MLSKDQDKWDIHWGYLTASLKAAKLDVVQTPSPEITDSNKKEIVFYSTGKPFKYTVMVFVKDWLLVLILFFAVAIFIA